MSKDKWKCKICGAPISQSSYYGKKRCQKCYMKSMKGKNNPNYKHGKCINPTCIDCGKSIGPQAIRCKDCENQHRSQVVRGKNHPFYNKKHTEKTKNKISQTKKLNGKSKGENNPSYIHGISREMLIKKYYQEMKTMQQIADELRVTRKVISLRFKQYNIQARNASECKRGKLCARYIDGRATKPYPYVWNAKLKAKIRKRDNYTCAICGKLQNKYSTNLCVHHIDYNKENCKEENLITLCRSCHSKTNTNRKKWLDFFRRN